MLFLDHFRRIAQGRFASRRLERAHGAAHMAQCYAELAALPQTLG
jgi:hypothetical protein